MIVRLLKDVIDLGVGVLGLFVLVLLAVALEIGFQGGRLCLAKQPPPANEIVGVSTLIIGMLALMAFTFALTISFAQDRFETRRHTTLADANTIGTGWLRTGLSGTPGKPIDELIERTTPVPGSPISRRQPRTRRLHRSRERTCCRHGSGKAPCRR